MAVSAAGGVERAVMVTMGVGVGAGVGVGGGGAAVTDTSASGVHGLIPPPAQCQQQSSSPPGQCQQQSNGAANGEPPWKTSPQDASKMAKIRDVVEGAAR